VRIWSKISNYFYTPTTFGAPIWGDSSKYFSDVCSEEARLVRIPCN